MNKIHKKLHSLLNALSHFNPLAAGILVKIVLMLVPQVRSARRHLLTPGTHRMFRHYSVCSGSIWKRLCARNTTDLVVKGWKSKYKFAVSLFSVFIFSFPSLLKIQVEDKGKDFHIARKLFKSTFIFWYKSLVFRCVPSRKLIAARIIFVISVIFKFTKISPWKNFEIFSLILLHFMYG